MEAELGQNIPLEKRCYRESVIILPLLKDIWKRRLIECSKRNIESSLLDESNRAYDSW